MTGTVTYPAIHQETIDTADIIARHATRLDKQTAGVPLNEHQMRALQTLLAIAPWHRLHVLNPTELTVRLIPKGITVLLDDRLSTCDTGGLTRLVVAAHDHAVRVELAAWHTTYLDDGDDNDIGQAVRQAIGDDLGYQPDSIGVTALKVTLTARERSGDRYSSHPTLEDAAAGYREFPGRRTG